MLKKNTPPKFNSFDEFYVYAVTDLKRKHPEYFRLDGRDKGASRKPFAYFQYREKWWKVDEDIWIEKLDKAYQFLLENQDPYIIASTKGGKNECLLIAGEPKSKKMFYVYLAKF
ncbi:hypothetical protein [Mucilaginibacter lacusdianchii]|uniref:hypothetical protein n=1 Tax=Mucilaginibacter lacusdianchii TaxID=2684211 RepID=UPI00131A683E|nr:hypothetical protein [Mucilaginibacter sp. JXJ CY 39]